ncbi:MAG TPA: phosphatidate cytidylyltransferase [Chitinophagaceae bacterium]|nr:phosphatidate cytidylyltransferase [Chitinophagaceae bacterium]
MALNIATFKTRAGTAAIFVVVMLGGLLWNYWSFFLLFSVIHFGCWIEYQQLVSKIDPGYKNISPFHQYGVMLAGWCMMLYFTHDSFNILGIKLSAIGWWLGIIAVFVLPITELLFSKQVELKNIGHSAFGLLYISLSLALLMHLRGMGMVRKGGDSFADINGFVLPLGILAAVWINDTMAYLVGSFIGKTPFSSISPKKTWEGTIGGAILCIVVIALLGRWSAVYQATDWICIAAIVAVFGVLGDLFESKLKRMAGVKDSGSIMPGHGGFLDRFDSLLMVSPFVWLYVIFFMK